MVETWTDESAHDWNKDPDQKDMLGRVLNKDDEEFLRRIVLPEYKTLIVAAKGAVGSIVLGQKDFVDNVFTGIAAGGHILMTGGVGLAKTLTMECISEVSHLDHKKTQFTPDLMPSDITGSMIWVPGQDGNGGEFLFDEGPVFTQLYLADEINRAPAKVHAALLEAMASRRVSVYRKTHYLPKPFIVLAAQNPVGQAGTTELTEAQRDRFMFNINIGYPDEEAERTLMVRTTEPSKSDSIRERHSRSAAGEDLTKAAEPERRLAAIFNRNTLALMQDDVRHLYLPKAVVDATTQIIRGLRPESTKSDDVRKYVEALGGPSPRAYQAFALATKSRALQRGEIAPHVGDVLAVARPVLEHRLNLSYKANKNNVTIDTLLAEVTQGLRRAGPQ